MGKSVNYELKGQGWPILLIHGWGGSLKSLSALADLLADKNQVILLDLPGFGSSSDPDNDWGIEEYSRIIIDIIDKLKIKPVVYFGHSFGGALGLNLAVKYPAYIKKLIVADASYRRSKPTSSILSRSLKWMPKIIKMLAYRLLYPQSDISKVPKLEANFRKIVTQDLTPLTSKVKIPTLILWGESDTQTPVNDGKYLNSRIKNAKLSIFPGIGHNLPLKKPELVNSEIQKFL